MHKIICFKASNPVNNKKNRGCNLIARWWSFSSCTYRFIKYLSPERIAMRHQTSILTFYTKLSKVNSNIIQWKRLIYVQLYIRTNKFLVYKISRLSVKLWNEKKESKTTRLTITKNKHFFHLYFLFLYLLFLLSTYFYFLLSLNLYVQYYKPLLMYQINTTPKKKTPSTTTTTNQFTKIIYTILQTILSSPLSTPSPPYYHHHTIFIFILNVYILYNIYRIFYTE